MTFQELGLREEILQALQDLGFEEPTPIQQQSIPQLLENERDLVGLAQTGTGKTAAFGIPLLERTDFSEKFVQAIVVAPTRELCVQISTDFKRFSKHIKGAQIATIYGGARIDTQAREIKKGAQVVVATPGRLIDMIKRRMVDLGKVRIAVLDEADEMLNMGFKEDIDTILDKAPQEKVVWLFSATMPKEVAKIASNYMTSPIEITVGSKNTANENIKHQYYCIRERDRYMALKRVLDYNPNIYGLIFCRTKRNTQDVADKLMKDGYNAEPIHGDLSQGQRDAVMAKFRDKTLQILVATDVAARGIDVDLITHVIHYNLPEDFENYTHRSGRTGRAGNRGISVALVTPKEVYKIRQIERKINMSCTLEKVPSGEEVCREQLFAMIDRIKSTEVKEDRISEYLPSINNLFEDFSKEDLIKAFVSSEFNKFLDYYKRAGDLNASASSNKAGRNEDREFDRKSGNKRNRNDKANQDEQRFFVNMGETHGLNKGAIVRLVCQHADISSVQVGRIDIFKEFSFFDVSKDIAEKVLKGMSDCEFNNKKMNVEFTSGSSNAGGNTNKRRSRDRSKPKRSPGQYNADNRPPRRRNRRR